MSTTQAVKRVLLGRTMASGELEHTLLPKILALPVFSSDPLSSNAYATQEILLVLGLVGVGALRHVMPITIAVTFLLITVVVSYRQTVRAYPSGGGAYVVAHENLGVYPGLLAAAALLIDYVLTVSVSITAGIDAIVSGVPELASERLLLAGLAVLIVTLANLRGAKESGTLFAIPTYGFVISIYVLVITGFVRCLGGQCPLAESAGLHLQPEHTLTLFLILKAFSAGTTALTGVEAISNGVPAFRYPQSHNAATTLTTMGAMSVTMFLGISWLAQRTHVVFVESADRTVVAQIAHAIFGGGFMFYVLQGMTAAILLLAANTAYQDFPRLSSILAQDRFMPRQFMNRGDRLVFSNGILILAFLAFALIAVFDADLNSLIQLYLVGVFISFTLSQSGMVVHWLRTREPSWRHRMVINAFGAVVTGVVFFVVVTTKFLGGAWIVVVSIPLLIALMRSINHHYERVAAELARPEPRLCERRPAEHHMVILVQRIDTASSRAVGYVRGVRPTGATALVLDRDTAAAWRRLAPDIPAHIVSAGPLVTGVKEHLRDVRKRLAPDDFLTLVVPELLEHRSLIEVVRRPRMHRLKAALIDEPGVQVLDVPVVKDDIDPDLDPAHEPIHNIGIVLVAGLHNATRQAIRYAETLQLESLRALSFELVPGASEELGRRWLMGGVPLPLEIEDSPFRDIGRSLNHYIDHLRPDGTTRVVTVIVPEFVVPKLRHRFLHGQSALLVKRHLLFQSGVVVASVPYRLGAPTSTARNEREREASRDVSTP